MGILKWLFNSEPKPSNSMSDHHYNGKYYSNHAIEAWNTVGLTALTPLLEIDEEITKQAENVSVSEFIDES